MSSRPPDSPVRLVGAGFTVVGTVVVGLLIGVGLNAWLHWAWAVPVMLLLGFVAGMVSMFRQLMR